MLAPAPRHPRHPRGPRAPRRFGPRGFTTVEAVAALVAVGLATVASMPHLSATAEREHRLAKLHAARSAVQSAAALIHGVASERRDQVQPPCAAVGFGNNPPQLDAAGNGNLCTQNGRVQVALLYPAATMAGIVAAAGLVPVVGTPSAAQLAVDGLQAVGDGRTLQIRLGGAARGGAECGFVYRAPGALGEAAQTGAAVTSGC